MNMRRKWNDESVVKLIEKYGTQGEKNPINLIRETARELVLKSFTKGWQGPPFDMVKLAELEGILVSPNSNVLDGRIIPQARGKYQIEYNPNQSRNRINFSIAHEIAHTFFPDCRDKVRNRYSKESIQLENNWELEFLCNVAASELLLPYAEFSREANSLPLNLETIKFLASRYNASIESVFLRFTEVVDAPCTVAIASYGMNGKLTIEYSKPSKESNLKFETGYQIPISSIAYKCIRPGVEGFTYPGSSEEYDNKGYSIFAIGLGALKHSTGLRVGIFFIPTEKADLPEKLIRTVNGDATQPQGDGKKLIIQMVNSSASVGSGFGRAMTKAYPESKLKLQNWKNNRSDFRLGKIQTFQVSSDVWVCQILAQHGLNPSKTEIPLKYWALRDCLSEVYLEAKDLGASIHMPAIGAGQAGGDWGVIEGMIHTELVSKGSNVTVYFLHGTNTLPKSESTLTLFDQV